jgi:hypothetical protein
MNSAERQGNFNQIETESEKKQRLDILAKSRRDRRAENAANEIETEDQSLSDKRSRIS